MSQGPLTASRGGEAWNSGPYGSSIRSFTPAGWGTSAAAAVQHKWLSRVQAQRASLELAPELLRGVRLQQLSLAAEGLFVRRRLPIRT